MRNGQRTGHVLVVEDDTSARDQLLRILRDDYEVFVASSSANAIDLLKKTPVDTVTLDPCMTGIQGRELLTGIREACPQARVIIVTRHRLSRWFDDMVRDEIFDYVPKPYDRRDLLRVVRQSMVRREVCHAR